MTQRARALSNQKKESRKKNMKKIDGIWKGKGNYMKRYSVYNKQIKEERKKIK